ncbi:MAG TPA: hypothetical protein DHV62_10575 [Elusimicrobia bacterium]|nr:hypothetical protein [Elusimicrobiota bacterium]
MVHCEKHFTFFLKKVKSEIVSLNLGNKRDKITVNTVSFEMIISNLVENAIKFNDKWLIKISVITERVERESKSRQ